jgi:hypothetical protein
VAKTTFQDDRARSNIGFPHHRTRRLPKRPSAHWIRPLTHGCWHGSCRGWLTPVGIIDSRSRPPVRS